VLESNESTPADLARKSDPMPYRKDTIADRGLESHHYKYRGFGVYYLMNKTGGGRKMFKVWQMRQVDLLVAQPLLKPLPLLW
jgi:hypothetical protein